MMKNHTPWQETVTLPVGHFDSQSETILREASLRKMTGKEEALLADRKLQGNGGKLITALLNSCVTALEGNGRVNRALIRNLTSADRNYLLLQLRRLTFGDEMEATYRCPSCRGMTRVIEDLTSIDVRRPENDQVDVEITVSLEDGYLDPDGNWQHELVFRLPTGEDEELAESRRDANPSRQRDALLARCLVQVGDLEARRFQAMGMRILADLSMSDRRLIQKALDESAPGPDLTRTVLCEHCWEEFRTSLDMSHFFPLA